MVCGNLAQKIPPFHHDILVLANLLSVDLVKGYVKFYIIMCDLEFYISLHYFLVALYYMSHKSHLVPGKWHCFDIFLVK